MSKTKISPQMSFITPEFLVVITLNVLTKMYNKVSTTGKYFCSAPLRLNETHARGMPGGGGRNTFDTIPIPIPISNTTLWDPGSTPAHQQHCKYPGSHWPITLTRKCI